LKRRQHLDGSHGGPQWLRRAVSRAELGCEIDFVPALREQDVADVAQRRDVLLRLFEQALHHFVVPRRRSAVRSPLVEFEGDEDPRYDSEGFERQQRPFTSFDPAERFPNALEQDHSAPRAANMSQLRPPTNPAMTGVWQLQLEQYA